MRLWPALLVTPLLALANVGFGYSLVSAACQTQKPWLVHGFTLGCLVLAVAATLLATTAPRVDQNRDFLATLSILSGAFFSLVIAANGLTHFILGPCMHL